MEGGLPKKGGLDSLQERGDGVFEGKADTPMHAMGAKDLVDVCMSMKLKILCLRMESRTSQSV